MKTTPRKQLAVFATLVLTLLVGLSVTVLAKDKEEPEHGPRKQPVTGTFNWVIVPPTFTPPYVLAGTPPDTDIYIRHMPLVGTFTLSGDGIGIEGKISVDFNAELDQTFSGVAWAPTVITANVNGVKTILFDGQGTADTVGLVSVGAFTLSGRGPFEGTKLEIKFEEIGPGNSDTYTFQGYLSPAPRR